MCIIHNFAKFITYSVLGWHDVISQSALEENKNYGLHLEERTLLFLLSLFFHISCYLCEQLKDKWININPAGVGAQYPL